MNQAQSQNLSHSKVEELVRHLYAQWSCGNVDGVVSCFAENCVFEDVTLESQAAGHTALRDLVEAVGAALPDLRWKVGLIAVDGELCTCECRFQGTLVKDLPGIPANNGRIDVRELVLLVIRNGKIQEYRGYWSMGMLLRQLDYTIATH